MLHNRKISLFAAMGLKSGAIGTRISESASPQGLSYDASECK